MRLIKKELQMNKETFAPELEVTLRMPLELASEEATDEFYLHVGKQLFEILKVKE